VKDGHGNTTIVRGAMLLATAVIVQEIRLFLPLPPLLSIFVVGTLVNAVLVVAARFTGLLAAALISFLLPVIALLQGHLAVPLLIPVIFCGNLALVAVCSRLRGKNALLLAPFCKTVLLYGATYGLLEWLALPKKIAAAVLFTMGWPQLITAFCGIMLAELLLGRLSEVKQAK